MVYPFDFDLPYDDWSILDAALRKGADLPFACKGGVCATCRAKLIEGQVEMDINYALEPEEMEQGYHPHLPIAPAHRESSRGL
jgi:ring-1,2-phenylacetyl-CoA epoxidase subunit PaaE